MSPIVASIVFSLVLILILVTILLVAKAKLLPSGKVKLLINGERLPGDPLKNRYNARRVYWYEVDGRFVTYIRL